MSATEQFVAAVPASLAGVRVDRAVSILLGVSRSVAVELVSGGRVLVDGVAVSDRSEPLQAGVQLQVAVPAPSPSGLAPDPDVAFGVVYEDGDLVVVDKPAGVVVHPGAGVHSGTLVQGLLARFPDIGALAGTACDPMRPGIVHRLDRGTSGLLVVARTPSAFRALSAQMAARSATRRYLALVVGHLESDEGIVDAPIGRSTRTPTKMAVSTRGRVARTRYRVVERIVVHAGATGAAPIPATLLECSLDTGRTHQVRVHLAAIGHPVIGDDRYDSRGRRPPAPMARGRLFLHAAVLGIVHPASGQPMAWTSPLPADLSSVIASSRAAPSSPTG